MGDITGFHRIGQDTTQAGVDSFHRPLCQKLSRAFSTHLPHGIVKIPKDFLVKFCQLVVAKGRQNTADEMCIRDRM